MEKKQELSCPVLNARGGLLDNPCEMISHVLGSAILVLRTDKLGQFVDFEKCLSVPSGGWRSPVDFHNDQIMKGQARGQGSVLDHVYKAARP